MNTEAFPVNSPNTKIRSLMNEDKLSSTFVRQCPGYAGFVPRAPPNVQLERRPDCGIMVSTMKAAYKSLPPEEYNKQPNARRGPFSRTVSLTSPFNPYNKVGPKCTATETLPID